MNRGIVIGGAVVVIGLLLGAANYHIVYGSSIDGVKFDKKPSLALSETFINLDIVGNMPMIAARSQYPMYVAKIEKRNEAVSLQRRNGCANIYVGMQIYEIIPKCGQPDTLKTSGADADMRWDSGVQIKTSGDKVTYVSGNR